MPAAISSAIIIPPLPPIRKPTPMNKAVMKARSMAVRITFIVISPSSDHGGFPPAQNALSCGPYNQRFQRTARRSTMQTADNDNLGHDHEETSHHTPLSPAAQRALREAEQRRKIAAAKSVPEEF